MIIILALETWHTKQAKHATMAASIYLKRSSVNFFGNMITIANMNSGEQNEHKPGRGQ